ncbi:ATP-binding protein [Quadrisphaera sp. DSM 44207]|uniref:ATP-binding protein n=1 Tax=Quadrisphaera sp. DSM 44207 TaxID=1881057 RepID=UPI00088FD872|nr:ATP-binding protein [Quadrisphaera sp. DSM 44207]SDQ11203.1 Signal transduction histidine kinase [Quadrisphaera sp. DSM 44207]
MHRRVQTATLAAVTLAVLLLGVPLAVAGVVLLGAQAAGSAQDRADALLVAVDARLQAGQPVDEELLQRYLDADPAWPGHVRVVVPGGDVVEAGEPVRGAAVTATASTADGLSVRVRVPRSLLLEADLRLVVLVLGLAAGAVAAGWAVGLVQARRLTRPLVELGRSAERLGSGQVPAPLQPTGVEEVDQVARALAGSAERLAARLAAERQFASDASHQLRTPLAALSLRLEEISSATSEPDVAEEARIALGQVERLVQVVDDLLERGRPGPSSPSAPLPLADVLVQQREEWAPAFARAHRRLEVELPRADPGGAPVRVLASPGPLAQALATLVENSLVHGGGTTRVTVRPGGEWVVVEVADQGPGVPEHLGARIFERSVSGAARTGLGLPLARDLVAAEGGRLELLSRRPATFALFLPAAG